MGANSGAAAWPALPPQPRVTIVTPSFNQAPFIEATIRSVLAQDYAAIEYIVMDGGSTDGTLDILRRYEDRLVWTSAPDRGQADAVNRGWQRGGEVLAWLNSDDVYLSGAVSAAVAGLRAHPGAAGVYGDCEYIDEAGRVIDLHPTSQFDYTTLVRTACTPIPQPATFLRRDAVAAIGYLDADLSMVMDLDLWLRLGLLAPLVYLPRPLARFREHAASKTIARQAQAAPEILSVYRRLFARGDLPAEIKAVESEALNGAMIYAGNSLLMAGQLGAARRYALAGVRGAGPRMRMMALKILLIAAFGQPGLSAYLRGRHGVKSALRNLTPRGRHA
jgi:glycosyltransferase involved in cell wall biosynthesis